MLKEVAGYLNTLESLLIPEHYIAIESKLNENNVRISKELKNSSNIISKYVDELTDIMKRINRKKYTGNLDIDKVETDAIIKKIMIEIRKIRKHLSEINVSKEDAINSIKTSAYNKEGIRTLVSSSLILALNIGALILSIIDNKNNSTFDSKVAVALNTSGTALGAISLADGVILRKKINKQLNEIKELSDNANFAEYNYYIKETQDAMISIEEYVMDLKKTIYAIIAKRKK